MYWLNTDQQVVHDDANEFQDHSPDTDCGCIEFDTYLVA